MSADGLQQLLDTARAERDEARRELSQTRMAVYLRGWRAGQAAKALEWIDQCQVDSNGDYHRHWIQGLLYGYSPEAIDEFLSRLSGRTSKSGVSTPRSQRKPGGARAEPKEGA